MSATEQGLGEASGQEARPQPGTSGAAMLSRHTPGPWAYETHELSSGYSSIVYAANGQRVGTDHLSAADAALIAAAPDMLKALKHAEATLRILSEELASLLSGAAKSCARDAAECRAAIAKATSPSASIGGE